MATADDDQHTADPLSVLALNKQSWKHPQPGGSDLNLEATLKPLAEKGHDVHVLVGSDGDRPRTERDGAITIHRTGIIDRLPSPLDLIGSYLLVSIAFYWYLYRLSPDVVYTVNTPLPWPVFTLRPRVAIYHHIAIDSFSETHSFPQSLFGSLAQRFGVFRDRSIPTVSVSPSTTQELVSRGHHPDSVYEIRNGLDIDEFEIGESADSPRIVYLGGLDTYKGVDRIPEIHCTLNEQQDSPVHLDVAGRDGPVRKEIEDYCDNTESATFHGYVTFSKKKSLLQDAWVFIAPSRVEGWGIAVLEANACGTPAVGSDVSGLRDSIIDGETGLLSDGSNPDEFADAIDTLLNDDERRTCFAKRARCWAEEHSWISAAIKLEEVFRIAIARK